jgi:hypothetical protein
MPLDGGSTEHVISSARTRDFYDPFSIVTRNDFMRGCDELTLTGRGSDLGYSVFCAAHIVVYIIRQAVQQLRNANRLLGPACTDLSKPSAG